MLMILSFDCSLRELLRWRYDGKDWEKNFSPNIQQNLIHEFQRVFISENNTVNSSLNITYHYVKYIYTNV